jgi:hypothetical protein
MNPVGLGCGGDFDFGLAVLAVAGPGKDRLVWMGLEKVAKALGAHQVHENSSFSMKKAGIHQIPEWLATCLAGQTDAL